MRLIDADKLKKHYSWWQGGTLAKTLDEMKRDFDTIIDLQPTAEPTASTCLGCNCPKMEKLEAEPVKHGRWLKNGDRYCECSVCHHEGNISGQDNYCWYCGARMDGGEDG